MPFRSFQPVVIATYLWSEHRPQIDATCTLSMEIRPSCLPPHAGDEPRDGSLEIPGRERNEIAGGLHASKKYGDRKIAATMHPNEVEVISTVQIHRQSRSFCTKTRRSNCRASLMWNDRIRRVPQPVLLCPERPIRILVEQEETFIHQADFLQTGASDVHGATSDAIEIGLDRLGVDRFVNRLPQADQGEIRPQLAPTKAPTTVNMAAADGRHDRAAYHPFSGCDGPINQSPQRVRVWFGVRVEIPGSVIIRHFQQSIEPSIDAAGIAEVLPGTTEPYPRRP